MAIAEVCDVCCGMGGSGEGETTKWNLTDTEAQEGDMAMPGVQPLVPFLSCPPRPHVLTSLSRLSFRDQLYCDLFAARAARARTPR